MLGSFIEVDIDIFELLLFLFVFLFFLLQLLFDLPRFLFQIFLLIRVVIDVHIMAPLCDFGCIESSTSIESRYRFSRIYGLRIGFLDLVVDAILFDVLLFISAVIEKRLVFDVVVNDEIVVLSDSLVGLTIVEVVVFGRVRMWVCLFEGKIVVRVVGVVVLLKVEGVVRYGLMHIGLSVYILGDLLIQTLDVSLKSCNGLFPIDVY